MSPLPDFDAVSHNESTTRRAKRSLPRLTTFEPRQFHTAWIGWDRSSMSRVKPRRKGWTHTPPWQCKSSTRWPRCSWAQRLFSRSSVRVPSRSTTFETRPAQSSAPGSCACSHGYYHLHVYLLNRHLPARARAAMAIIASTSLDTATISASGPSSGLFGTMRSASALIGRMKR